MVKKVFAGEKNTSVYYVNKVDIPQHSSPVLPDGSSCGFQVYSSDDELVYCYADFVEAIEEAEFLGIGSYVYSLARERLVYLVEDDEEEDDLV